MIRISQIKLNIDHTDEDIKRSILKKIKISEKNLISYKIVKKSIDARKNNIQYIYTVEIQVHDEEKLVTRLKDKDIIIAKENPYDYIPTGSKASKSRPVIIGSGPAGMFCAYMLAEQGYAPLVIERGEEVGKRVETVNGYWKTNQLNPNSNVQFGEGGAGTFSDGKLNTLVKEEHGRNKKVLEVYVENGAPSEILFLNKPHIGTDKLVDVVKNMRERIISLGGEVMFNTVMTDVIIEEKKVVAIEINHSKVIPCETLVLAIGHSARDTFETIHKKGLDMEKKSFAIGLRIQHPQELISKAQYSSSYDKLPPADYKLAHMAKSGRSIYSFCMCPGGFVVNSSSEQGGLVVNGMSNHSRNEENANSALIVSIKPEDFHSDSPLAGVEFQRKWERLAFEAGKGNIPIQLLGDLVHNRVSTTIGGIKPIIKGDYHLSNLRACLPDFVTDSIIEGIEAFDHKIHGFANEEAILAGVETRTSSPLRIKRDLNYQSNILGIYPCGEGAGYAGGITSAAMDGIRTYEAIAHKFKP